MGAVGGLLGVAGGANGTGFAAPSSSNLQLPTTVAQVNNAANNTQGGLQQQQAFLNALAAQHGIQNQSNVFNQLQGVANGTGPNPALAQLNQATGQNVANQAALMAGQRGAGANAGLIARQAAQQGAQTQQNAAGQAATLQAQQQLNALNQLGGIAGQQVGQQAQATSANNQFLQNEQQQLLNAIQGQNKAQVGISGQNAALAGQQMQGQQNLIGNITGGIGSALGLAHGGQIPHYAGGGYTLQSADYNNNDPVFQSSPTASGATPLDLPMPQALAAPVAPSIPQVPAAAPQVSPAPAQSGPKSIIGKFMQGATQSNQDKTPLTGMSAAGNTIGKGIGAGLSALFGGHSTPAQSTIPASEVNLQNDLLQHNAYQGNTQDVGANNIDTSQDGMPMAAKGGKVPAMVSPGEKYLDRSDVKEVAKGADPMEVGKTIKGKAKVPGNVDSYKNDTIRKDLESGGIILPRSVTQSKHPHWEAHKFVSQIMAKNGGKLPRK